MTTVLRGWWTRAWGLPLVLAAATPAQQQARDQAPGPGARRLDAFAVHCARAASSPYAPLTWRALGPKRCGGRIETIASPRSAPNVLYAGVGSGGVWKSIDGGLSWRHVFAREASCAVGDVAIDPQDADVVWVGTGEAHLGGISYDGAGIYRSEDGGSTWQNMGLVDSGRIAKVLVDPRDQDVVHVAVIGRGRGAAQDRGVHTTRDGGRTWRQTLAPGPHCGVIDLVLDPHDPDRLFAAAWDRRRRGDGGVFRSEDGGRSWQKLGGGLLDGPAVGRLALAICASSPEVVYALLVDHSPPGEGRYDCGGALFRSDDGGDSWRRTAETYVDTYVGWDFCDVRVAPDDPDEVYVCGMRLMISRDGGATFARGGESVYRLHDHPGRGMHLDMHGLWIDPDRPHRLLLCNDGGLYESRDRGRSWLHLNNLPIAELYTVFLEDTPAATAPFRIWIGTQDNASLVAPADARLIDVEPDAWRYVFLDGWDGGDGFATFPARSGDGTIYYEQQHGAMKRLRPGAPLRWSNGSGRAIRPRAAKGEPALRFAWNTPLLPSTHDADTLYCACQYVMRSTDRGDSWTRLSDDLGGGRGEVVVLCESPHKPARLAAAVRGGTKRLWVCADAESSWRDVCGALPRGAVTALFASSHDPNRLYVALDGSPGEPGDPALYRSDDFGGSWHAIGAGLPATPITAIAEDAGAGGTVFIGSEFGVYARGSKGWHVLGSGLPTAPVVALSVHAPSGSLVAGTHGLGAFLIDVGSLRREDRISERSPR